MSDIVDAVRAENRAGGPPVALFAGTKTQVGLTEHERIDGTEPDLPRSPYGRQKPAAENVLKDATAEGVLRGVSLRLPTVYGHGPESTTDDRGVVSAMARRAMAGEQLTMWHDGSVRRDLLARVVSVWRIRFLGEPGLAGDASVVPQPGEHSESASILECVARHPRSVVDRGCRVLSKGRRAWPAAWPGRRIRDGRSPAGQRHVRSM